MQTITFGFMFTALNTSASARAVYKFQNKRSCVLGFQ